ncbi:uncharacterized protein LOC101849829 isoform X2 [Aplysia californica]|uniref:Uncharacterized protein LOC101849829 isoform X2 n=1 Tax=Aplysia californica TaxID=6500 RepID=A0ABM0JI02_APLCA|nr:uncharacterized protein LOC101849829 isoform X2 [Aplysia californica]
MANNGGSEFVIRNIKQDEVEETFDMIARLGWNLTKEKFKMLCEKKPNNFYVAVTQDGEVAATLSCTPTFADEYILGNVIVKETMQKRGLGRRIVEDILEMVPRKIVHLVSLPAVNKFYLNLGFKLSEPQQGHIISHIVTDVQLLDNKVKTIKGVADDISIAPLDESSLEDLIQFDHRLRGYDNSLFVSTLAVCSRLLVARNKSQNNKIVGYVAAFLKKDEIILDGLNAESDDVAALLFREILNQFPGTVKVKLQMFDSNQFLLQFGGEATTERYNRFSLGGNPTIVPEATAYNVSDCDFTH